jgi:hypothetical protein
LNRKNPNRGYQKEDANYVGALLSNLISGKNANQAVNSTTLQDANGKLNSKNQSTNTLLNALKTPVNPPLQGANRAAPAQTNTKQYAAQNTQNQKSGAFPNNSPQGTSTGTITNSAAPVKVITPFLI